MMRNSDVARKFDAVATTYDSHFRRNIDIAEDSAVKRLLGKLLKPNRKMLDVGCGTGNLIKFFNPSPEKYFGIDISSKMLEIAIINYPKHRFMKMDTTNLSWIGNGEYAQVVSLFGSISYIEDKRLALEEIHRVLKPKGEIFLMLLADEYVNRKHHIVDDSIHPISRLGIAKLMSGLFDVKIIGFNSLKDRYCGLPLPLLDAYFRFEGLTAFEHKPYLYIVTGVKL